MQQILEQLNVLKGFSGNNQISYLLSIKSDLMREVLEYTYDTHKKYKIESGKYDKFPISFGNRILTRDVWDEFKQILDNLSNLKSANDNTVKGVVDYINQFEETSQDFLKKVLFKDLRINMNKAKFQKVWSNFLIECQVQLAQGYNGQHFNHARYSRKMDGTRVYFMDGVAYSRSNKPYHTEPIQHIIEQIKQLSDYDKYVFDGEMIYLNQDGSEDFQKGISLVRSEKRQDECDNIYFIVFDMIAKDNFVTKQPYIPFEQEYQDMKNYFKINEEGFNWFKTCQPNLLLIKQRTEEEFPDLQQAIVKYGYEGAMLRNGDACYEYKRSNNLLKIKAMQDTEVKLLAMQEGTGKHEGRLGALLVDYKGNQVRIGSGFSDEQRIRYWNNQQDYIGKTVKVQYFEETINQQGTLSLRFPVFLCFRDKDTMEEYI